MTVSSSAVVSASSARFGRQPSGSLCGIGVLRLATQADRPGPGTRRGGDRLGLGSLGLGLFGQRQRVRRVCRLVRRVLDRISVGHRCTAP